MLLLETRLQILEVHGNTGLGSFWTGSKILNRPEYWLS
jgi:hypothetical protein